MDDLVDIDALLGNLELEEEQNTQHTKPVPSSPSGASNIQSYTNGFNSTNTSANGFHNGMLDYI